MSSCFKVELSRGSLPFQLIVLTARFADRHQLDMRQADTIKLKTLETENSHQIDFKRQRNDPWSHMSETRYSLILKSHCQLTRVVERMTSNQKVNTVI